MNILVLTGETSSNTRLLGAKVKVDNTECGSFPSNAQFIQYNQWYTF